MEQLLGAKGTKPGSKATARKGTLGANGKPPRVPVGVLHLIDAAAPSMGASFTAICGETGLESIDGSWDDDYPNDRCPTCADQQWMQSFAEMQNDLLK